MSDVGEVYRMIGNPGSAIAATPPASDPRPSHAGGSTMSDVGEVYLMIGNPGVGKSTILNGLLGACHFKSGLSFGAGMTFQLDKYTTETGVTYADTPGLADTEKRQQAAAAITEALKLGGRFRIFFVVCLMQGRVNPEDVATMKLVLEAAPITSYGIIINQLSDKEHGLLTAEGSDGRGPSPREKVLRQLLAGLDPEKITYSVELIKRDEELDGQDDTVKPVPQGVELFIRSLPPVVIEPSEVQRVRADAFEEERDLLTTKLEETDKKNQALRETLKGTEEQLARAATKVEDHRRELNRQAELWERKESEWGKKRKELDDKIVVSENAQRGLRDETGRLNGELTSLRRDNDAKQRTIERLEGPAQKTDAPANKADAPAKKADAPEKKADTPAKVPDEAAKKATDLEAERAAQRAAERKEKEARCRWRMWGFGTAAVAGLVTLCSAGMAAPVIAIAAGTVTVTGTGVGVAHLD